MTKKITQEKILKDFMSRVNKLGIDRSTNDKWYGKVTCVAYATAKGSYGQNVARSAYGTRKFTVSGSKMIANGKYTLRTLRAKLEAAIAAR